MLVPDNQAMLGRLDRIETELANVRGLMNALAWLLLQDAFERRQREALDADGDEESEDSPPKPH